MNIRETDFSPEFSFRTSRSSGPGGQNVNKVETRVELLFNISESQLLDEKQKGRIRKKLANKINKDDVLIVSAQKERSQSKNKERAINKFYDWLEKALKKKKKRKATKPSKAAKEKRLKEKKIQSEKKQQRRNDLF